EAGEGVVGGRTRRHQVLRDHGELAACATLQQQDLVAVGHREQRAQERDRGGLNPLVGRAAVALLDDRQAAALEVDEIFAGTEEYDLGQGGRSGAEVDRHWHSPIAGTQTWRRLASTRSTSSPAEPRYAVGSKICSIAPGSRTWLSSWLARAHSRT